MNEQKELIVKLENLEGPQSSAKSRAANIAGSVAGAIGAALVAVAAGSSVTERNPITGMTSKKKASKNDIKSLIKERVESF
jgi:hypothetical protein